jgi:hypothetical protein
MPATTKMIAYARTLIDRCGYSHDDYPLEEWSYQDVSNLIDELKAELGWD